MLLSPGALPLRAASPRLGAKGQDAALTHPLPEGSLEEEGQRRACVVTKTRTPPMSAHHPLRTPLRDLGVFTATSLTPGDPTAPER